MNLHRIRSQIEKGHVIKNFSNKDEINRITMTTEFNGRQLLSAENSENIQIFIGSNSRAATTTQI